MKFFFSPQVAELWLASNSVGLTPDEWFDAWRTKLDDWYLALPAATRGDLGACLGAFGLHLASRLQHKFGLWKRLFTDDLAPPQPTEKGGGKEDV